MNNPNTPLPNSGEVERWMKSLGWVKYQNYWSYKDTVTTMSLNAAVILYQVCRDAEVKGRREQLQKVLKRWGQGKDYNFSRWITAQLGNLTPKDIPDAE